MGYPVVVEDYIPDVKIIFGNFSLLQKPLKLQKILLQAKGSTVYIAMGLADGKVTLDEAFNVLSVQAG